MSGRGTDLQFAGSSGRGVIKIADGPPFKLFDALMALDQQCENKQLSYGRVKATIQVAGGRLIYAAWIPKRREAVTAR